MTKETSHDDGTAPLSHDDARKPHSRTRVIRPKLDRPTSSSGVLGVSADILPAASDGRSLLQIMQGAPMAEAPGQPSVWDEKPDSACPYATGQVAAVPLHLLTEDPFNAREMYRVEDIDEMTRSLQQKGQDVPIAAYWWEGRFWVFDGVKRLKSARSGGLPTLRVEVKARPDTPLEIYLASRRMNSQRSEQSVLDDAIRWGQLLDQKLVESQQDLAVRIGCGAPYVSMVLSINRIPRDVLLYMKDHPASTEQMIAYKISLIFNKERRAAYEEERLIEIAKEVIAEVERKGLNRAETDRAILRRFQEPRHRASANRQAVTFGAAKGLLKVFPKTGKLALHIEGLDEIHLAQLESRLKSLFEADTTVPER